MTRGPEIDGENRRQNCVQTDFRQLNQAAVMRRLALNMTAWLVQEMRVRFRDRYRLSWRWVLDRAGSTAASAGFTKQWRP